MDIHVNNDDCGSPLKEGIGLGRWLKVSIMVLRSSWRNCISHSTISIKPPKVIHVVVVVMVGKISMCTRDHCCVVG